MIVVLGVGNFLHGDDGAGPAVAAGVLALGLPGVSAFDCGTAPENFTGVVRRLHPDLLVVADAADMGLPAGSFGGCGGGDCGGWCAAVMDGGR